MTCSILYPTRDRVQRYFSDSKFLFQGRRDEKREGEVFLALSKVNIANGTTDPGVDCFNQSAYFTCVAYPTPRIALSVRWSVRKAHIFNGRRSSSSSRRTCIIDTCIIPTSSYIIPTCMHHVYMHHGYIHR